MIEVVFGSRFLDSAQQLSQPQREKLATLLACFKDNPFHPLLHTKRLSGPLTGFCAFRITRDWRVIFVFRSITTVQVLHVVHRRDAYR